MKQSTEQAKAPRLVEATERPRHRIVIDAPTPTPAERAAVADKLARLREAALSSPVQSVCNRAG